MAEDVAMTLDRVEALVRERRIDDAIDELRTALATHRSVELETALLRVRHHGFALLDRSEGPSSPWPVPAEPLEPAGALPEVPVEDLTASVISAALLHHGSLVVRGMVDPERAASLRAVIDDAFEGAAKWRDDPEVDASPAFIPFEPDEQYPFGIYERAFATFGSGVLGVDCPTAMYELLEAFDAVGMRRIMEEYFGERPAFSVKKTTLRRTEPDSLAGWHQDGAFLGTTTRALNIWTALSPCGVDAAGLDLFPQRFDELVPTGGPEIYDWSVSDETASTYGLERLVRPVFDTGDAVLFDQMTLHRTGVDPSMTKTRYAIEMWFFAPSTYPLEQIPILL